WCQGGELSKPDHRLIRRPRKSLKFFVRSIVSLIVDAYFAVQLTVWIPAQINLHPMQTFFFEFCHHRVCHQCKRRVFIEYFVQTSVLIVGYYLSQNHIPRQTLVTAARQQGDLLKSPF